MPKQLTPNLIHSMEPRRLIEQIPFTYAESDLLHGWTPFLRERMSKRHYRRLRGKLKETRRHG